MINLKYKTYQIIVYLFVTHNNPDKGILNYWLRLDQVLRDPLSLRSPRLHSNNFSQLLLAVRQYNLHQTHCLQTQPGPIHSHVAYCDWHNTCSDCTIEWHFAHTIPIYVAPSSSLASHTHLPCFSIIITWWYQYCSAFIWKIELHYPADFKSCSTTNFTSDDSLYGSPTWEFSTINS